MSDDLPLRPQFQALADDDAPPLDLRSPSFDPVQPGASSRAWRIFSIGAFGACVLGLGLGVMTLKGEAATGSAKAGAPTSAAFRPIKADYVAPDREQIARALEESKRLMDAQGLSGLARASIVCFEKLAREPGYPLMDYCLALDIYGAQAYARTAGEAAPPSTYFGQGPVRRQNAVQALIAGQTDVNSRLIDTHRLAEDVSLKTQLAALGVPETVEAAPVLTVAQIEAPPPPPPPPPEPPAAIAKAEPAPVKASAVKAIPVQAAKARVHAAKPTVVAAKAARVRPPKRDRATAPRTKLAKKAAPSVRALSKAKPPTKAKVAPKPAPVEAEPNWPDVLLTRLRSEERREALEPLRRY